MSTSNWTELTGGIKRELKLLPDRIQLWQVFSSVSHSILATVEPHLIADERTRAQRFRFQRDRDAYVLSRGLLRQLLAAYTGDDPARIQFHYGKHGKPEIAGSDIGFNVSHSGDAVLLGFALNRELGVDVERMQPDMDFAGLAKTSFSQIEQDAVLALASEQRANLFYEYWTCKEACIKADGRGLSAPLDQFSIVVSAQGPQWREVAGASAGVFDSPWRIRILDTIPGYATAVAAAGRAWDVENMDLQDFPALQK